MLSNISQIGIYTLRLKIAQYINAFANILNIPLYMFAKLQMFVFELTAIARRI